MMLQSSERKPMLSFIVPDTLKMTSEKNVMGICQLIADCRLRSGKFVEKLNSISR